MQVRAPQEFQGTVIGDVNRRKGLILNSEGEDLDVVISAQVTHSGRCAMLPRQHATSEPGTSNELKNESKPVKRQWRLPTLL